MVKVWKVFSGIISHMAKKKEIIEEVIVEPVAPAFDPDIPENKQRWLR